MEEGAWEADTAAARIDTADMEAADTVWADRAAAGIAADTAVRDNRWNSPAADFEPVRAAETAAQDYCNRCSFCSSE